VAPWFVDDAAQRFAAYGWHVIGPVDGHDVAAVVTPRWPGQAHGGRQADAGRSASTTIGKGSPNRAGTAKAHGEPLGAEEIKRPRAKPGLAARALRDPEDAYAAWDAKRPRSRSAGRLERTVRGLPLGAPRAGRRVPAPHARRPAGRLRQTAVDAALAAAHAKAETVASRKASQLALEAFTAALPELLGGSADLTGSNLTNTSSTRRRCASTTPARPTAVATSTTACASSAWPR
jgi:transketolase